MKIARFLFVAIFVTLLCLFYVHQRVEVIKLSYIIKENHKNFVQLLDHNKFLVYNVNAIKSPANLEKILIAKNVKLESPAKWEELRLAKATKPSPTQQVVSRSLFEKTKYALVAFFSLKSQAEAKTIK